jgi:hypothetical protein
VKNDPAVAWRMANAINTGRETLRKSVGETSEIDKSIAQGLASFNRTLAGQTGNSKVAAQQAQAVQMYAYQLASEGARDPAGQAVQDIIGKHYTFADTYRVPTGVSPDAISTGASVLRRELPTSAVRAETSLADPRMSVETRQNMSSQILRGKGVWLTMPDDSGLYLAYPQEAGFVPGRLANGKTISYSWAQITAAAERSGAVERSDAMLKAIQ